MPSQSAGLLMCRKARDGMEYFLVHPGGPFYARKDEGYWSIPKGMPEPNEDMLACACREFREETSIAPLPPFHALDSLKQKSGKVVHAWAFIGEWDPAHGIVSNTVQIEWPPRSAKRISVPEVDRAAWMNYDQATRMIMPAQAPFLKRALERLP